MSATTGAVTPAQRWMLTVLSYYDRDGAQDPIYFDTRNGNVKNVLRHLAAKGLVVIKPDLDDESRWFAALPSMTEVTV